MIIDAHLDTALLLRRQPTLRSLTDSHCDLLRLQQYLDVAFFAIFIHPEDYADCQLREMVDMWVRLRRDLRANTDLVEPLLYKEQLSEPGAKVLLGAEGGGFLGNRESLLPLFFDRGLRFLGLTWNMDNQLAAACGNSGGLTGLGQKVVRLCNRLHVAVDAAHLSEDGFWQLLEESERPIMVSHAACAALLPHKRNLTDSQLRALGQAGGVIGVTFVRDFLRAEEADLSDVVRHIAHAVEVAGIDAVGIGSDFDGADIAGLRGVQDLPFLWQALAEAGFSQEEIDKISGENFRLFLQKVLPTREMCQE